jgi:cation:H+ antiporter
MEHYLSELSASLPLVVLFVIIAGAVFVLTKGADVLVEEAVGISRRFDVSPVIIGATVVSLGTTAPETAVSVFSAIGGDPGLALGNAVGSVICNTALIIGIAALIRPIPVDRKMLARQGAIQFGSAMLLVVLSLPFAALATTFVSGGQFSQFSAAVFLVLLAGYLYASVHWARQSSAVPAGEVVESVEVLKPLGKSIVLLLIGLAMVLLASQILIPVVENTALRLGVPQAVVAASLVALGTSLPELVTAITASRQGHGELALGNVVGANVLNVLFVVGLSGAVTPGGLTVSSEFFRLFYPAMIGSGIFLYITAVAGQPRIGRSVGVVLLVIYVGLVIAGYGV